MHAFQYTTIATPREPTEGVVKITEGPKSRATSTAKTTEKKRDNTSMYLYLLYRNEQKINKTTNIHIIIFINAKIKNINNLQIYISLYIMMI